MVENKFSFERGLKTIFYFEMRAVFEVSTKVI